MMDFVFFVLKFCVSLVAVVFILRVTVDTLDDLLK